MDIFIYFTSKASIVLDEIEDAIQEALGDKGEVTGSGLGKAGANIDVEIYEDEDGEEAANSIIECLKNMKVPIDTYMRIEDRKVSVFEDGDQHRT